MAEKKRRGLDPDVLTEKRLKISHDLDEICALLYKGTQSKIKGQELVAVKKRAVDKITDYEALLAELHGGQREGLVRGYGSEIELLRERLAKLDA